jgi:hypothetical protein
MQKIRRKPNGAQIEYQISFKSSHFVLSIKISDPSSDNFHVFPLSFFSFIKFNNESLYICIYIFFILCVDSKTSRPLLIELMTNEHIFQYCFKSSFDSSV